MTRSHRVLVASLAALALALAGCGGAMMASKASYDEAYAPAPAQAAGNGDATGGGGYAQPAEPSSVASEEYAFEDAKMERDEVDRAPMKSSANAESSGKKGYDSGAEKPAQQQQQQQAQIGAKTDAPDAPLVVYTGFLHLRVKRLLDAIDAVTRLTEEKSGYIESLAQRVVVVRIPAKNFDAVMAEFAALGELLERRVKALDVTEQFTDLGARLAVAKEARNRLVALLAKTEDVEERLRILQEVKRLSEQIETIESTLATLQNLVDYFTITIELEPVLEDSGGEQHSSPFAWIRELAAHRTTIFDGADDVSLALPAGFVLFEKDDVYRAQSADTTVIRGGIVDNEPRGDNAYWIRAVKHEMDGRGEKVVADGDSGPVKYAVFESEDVQPRWYLVGVVAHGEDLCVVEVFFPNEEAFTAHKDAVIKSLATFEVK
jgi:hypothetical protein